jgi:hypothetical protein
VINNMPLPVYTPQARLMEERAKLEAAVTAQIEAEKIALLEKKRREQVSIG